MKNYHINTPYGTSYVIDEDGCFLMYNEHTWKHPHDTWRCTGCAELLPFGNLKFYILNTFLSMIIEGKIVKFKNGNPRFTLTDLDHGIDRVHGNTKHHGISSAYKIT